MSKTEKFLTTLVGLLAFGLFAFYVWGVIAVEARRSACEAPGVGGLYVSGVCISRDAVIDVGAGR